LAKCSGFEETPTNDQCLSGECVKQCRCNRKYDPYCCEDEEYSNSSIGVGMNSNDACVRGRCNTCKCTADIDPVCCNGREYANECAADCEGYIDAKQNDLCEPHSCDVQYNGAGDNVNEDEPCTADYVPVRGDTTVTFDNICIAETQGNVNDCDQDCVDGACAYDCGCVSAETDQNVCCFEIEYENECLAICAGVMKPDKKCSISQCHGRGSEPLAPCVCEDIENPICCEDGGLTRQFVSPCEECAGYDAPAIDDAHCILGTCEEDFPCGCQQIYPPVCCDGVDYASQCDADCELCNFTYFFACALDLEQLQNFATTLGICMHFQDQLQNFAIIFCN